MEPRFRTILEISTVRILCFDLEGGITHANEAFLISGD
jgi:PAS domain-containing protein